MKYVNTLRQSDLFSSQIACWSSTIRMCSLMILADRYQYCGNDFIESRA